MLSGVGAGALAEGLSEPHTWSIVMWRSVCTSLFSLLKYLSLSLSTLKWKISADNTERLAVMKIVEKPQSE
jgi:hypothetical protein